ncbi:transmembrane amino acid transporter protein-domain-containing protein [Xylaria longipes]|nr:transmembrane amino acid transporter protein-domain-containing protein [Xylaria longipes]
MARDGWRPSWLFFPCIHLSRGTTQPDRQATMAEKTDNELSTPSSPPAPTSYYPPRQRKVHDSRVTFEEYHYYAQRTREEQLLLEAPQWQWRSVFSSHKKTAGAVQEEHHHTGASHGGLVTDEEWVDASRAFRTASWGAVFYLITTDILGPFAVPFAIGTLGYGPGIGIFTAFGIISVYSGYLLWKVFMGVDSHEFPARNYGDLAFRAWGTIARHVVNVLQAVALLLLLGQVTILFGQNISEMSKYRICYVVCPLIFVVVGFFLTQIRTLRSFGWLANFGFWFNILAIFISMGATAHNPPNFSIATLGSVGSAIDPTSIMPDANGNYPPIVTHAGLPTTNLIGSINGLLSGVLAFAGLQLFIEFMAEMRRPHDFLKGMFIAQAVIYTAYVVYGSFMYYYQGQYTFNPAYLGVSDYGWQTAGNTLTLLSGLIAAALYGNIGIKVFYNNVLVDIFRAPLITSKGGKIFYAAIVPVWWSIAFVIAAAIPAYVYFVSIISAAALLNLSYTIPAWIALGYDIKKATMGDFDPAVGRTSRGLTGFNRYIRGFWSGGTFQILINIWHVLYFLASLSLSGLGLYASIEGFIEAFEIPQLDSFTCRSPLNLGT